MTWVDEGGVAHMRGDKLFFVQVCDPIMELIVTSHDKVALFIVQFVEYGEGDAKPITVGRGVWGVDSVVEEECVAPSMIPPYPSH